MSGRRVVWGVNGMFGVFKGYNIKGVLFHQGYNNAMIRQNCRPKLYRVQIYCPRTVSPRALGGNCGSSRKPTISRHQSDNSWNRGFHQTPG